MKPIAQDTISLNEATWRAGLSRSELETLASGFDSMEHNRVQVAQLLGCSIPTTRPLLTVLGPAFL